MAKTIGALPPLPTEPSASVEAEDGPVVVDRPEAGVVGVRSVPAAPLGRTTASEPVCHVSPETLSVAKTTVPQEA